MVGSTAKGPSTAIPTSPMGSGILAGNTAPFPEAPQLNAMQQIGNGLNGLTSGPATAQTPQQKHRSQAFQQMVQPAQQPNFAPAQFGAPGASGTQLSQFLATLMKNQGGSNGV